MTSRPDTPLSPSLGYALWARAYDTENAVTTLDERVVRELTPPLRGKRLLDAGCGTGRRLPEEGPGGPALVVGLDLVPEMLRACRRPARLVNANLLQLPLAPGTFDLLWCRLVMSHTTDLEMAYRELARAAAESAVLVVTDMHPVPLQRGHHRTFRDEAGALRSVQSYPYTVADHDRAASGAGWRIEEQRDVRVGPDLRDHYAQRDALDRYQAQLGMPLLLVLRLRRASVS